MILVSRLRGNLFPCLSPLNPRGQSRAPQRHTSIIPVVATASEARSRVVVKAFCGTRNGRLESRRIPMRGSLGAEFCVPIPFHASKLPEYRQQHYAMLGSLMIALPVLFLSLTARRNNNLHPTTVLFLAKPHCFSILIFS